MTGPILRDTATGKYLLVIHGVAAGGHVLHLEQIFPAFIVRKRTCMSKAYTVENILGWACLTSTLRGHSCGAMEHRLTSITGRNTSQTTFTMRTVFTLLASFKVISTNGTMSIARTVTDSPAKKVQYTMF